MSLSNWQLRLAEFQLMIARRWSEKGDEEEHDVLSQFFFYYTGFNAIYFVWGEIDRKEAGDQCRMRNMMGKMNESAASNILHQCSKSVDFFSDRVITDMRYRCDDDPGIGRVPDPDPSRTLLNKRASPTEKIKALGDVVYQVRCNLAHGGKDIRGDDKAIVTKCITPLQEFLRFALMYTENALGQGGN